MSKLIIVVWYPYVSLFPDLLCNIGLSVSGLRKIRFNAYTPSRISTKNQFSNKPGFPLSKLIILVWYPYVSLLPDLLCYRLECQWFTQNTFQHLYTPSNFHKKSVPKQTRFPLSKLIILVWYPYVSLFPDLLCYRLECQWFTQNTFQRLYTQPNFHKKISSQTNQDFRFPR